MRKFLLDNKKTILIIKAVIGIAIIAVIYFSLESRRGVQEAFLNSNKVNLLLAFIMVFINIILQFLKYNVLLKASGIKVNAKTVAESLLFGFTLGFITPGNIGELGKAVYFKNVDRWEASAAVMVDKLLNMIAVYFVGSVTLLILMFNYSSFPFYFILLYMSFFIFAFFVFLFFLKFPAVFFYGAVKLKMSLTVRKKIFRVIRAVNRISSAALLQAFMWGVIWVIVITLQYHMVLLGFISVSVKASLLAVPSMLMLKMALPITIGDLGIRESALIFCYGFFALDPEYIVYSGMIILVYNMIFPAALGAFYLKNVDLNV